jgi:hypothetical protein
MKLARGLGRGAAGLSFFASGYAANDALDRGDSEGAFVNASDAGVDLAVLLGGPVTWIGGAAYGLGRYSAVPSEGGIVTGAEGASTGGDASGAGGTGGY